MLSSKGFQFYLSIIDDFSKYTWLFPLHLKSDVVTIFLAFLQYVNNTFSSNVIVIQINWGGEFRPLNPLLKYFGISLHIICPYSHSQNGTVERRHRHIVEIGLSLLVHSFMSNKFWAKAFQLENFLIDSMPTPILKYASPFQTLFQRISVIPFFVFLGLLVGHISEIDLQSHLCVFIG